MEGTINQSESCTEVPEVHGGAQRYVEVCRGARRCMEVCAEVCAEVRGGTRRCAKVRGGVHRCTEVFQRGGGEKNQDFMLIRFLNAGI